MDEDLTIDRITCSAPRLGGRGEAPEKRSYATGVDRRRVGKRLISNSTLGMKSVVTALRPTGPRSGKRVIGFPRTLTEPTKCMHKPCVGYEARMSRGPWSVRMKLPVNDKQWTPAVEVTTTTSS